MRQLITILSITLCIFSCAKKSNSTINYSISPVNKDGVSLLKIKTSFKANVEGKTVLLFQNKAWGQDSLHNVIHDIKVVSEKGTITQNRDSGWYVINHPKDLKKLNVEYHIKQNTDGDLTTWDTYRPIVQPHYFHVFSHNFFMLPQHVVKASDDDFNVTINWEGFPENFKIANSFASNELSHTIENISQEKFHYGVFVGGDFRIHELDVKGKKVAFAIRGNWEVFNDSTMIDMLKKTVTAQRDFWKDHTQDYYAVTMIPTVQERGSGFQGSGLTNSFAINATNNKELEIEGLVYLFNHELQHNWTGTLIKNDDEEKQYWFSEGFTDYYTLKNIARDNIHGLDESYFIVEFNKFVKALYTNPAKEMPNSEMTYENFWSGKESIQKLPYRRGALLAFYLDNKIKQDTNGEKSLDDVLLDFKNDAIKSEQKITHPYFIETLNKYLKDDFKSFFDTHIEEGKLYNTVGIFEDFGFEYHPTAKVFDLGFEFTKDRKNIASINESSEAYKAGLRKGDRLTSISYYYSSDYPAKFTVLRNKKEIKIEYMPEKDAEIPLLKDNEHNKKQLGF